MRIEKKSLEMCFFMLVWMEYDYLYNYGYIYHHHDQYQPDQIGYSDGRFYAAYPLLQLQQHQRRQYQDPAKPDSQLHSSISATVLFDSTDKEYVYYSAELCF